jgi:hypothetical protein
VPEIVAALDGVGLKRADVRLWSAHYIGAHICSPRCWGPLGNTAWGSISADGTQFTDTADGRSLDESELNGDFFGTAAPKPKPVKHATGLLPLAVSFNADPPHGHNWSVARAPGGNFSPGSEDHWAAAEIEVNTKTGQARIVGEAFNSKPLGG